MKRMLVIAVIAVLSLGLASPIVTLAAKGIDERLGVPIVVYGANLSGR